MARQGERARTRSTAGAGRGVPRLPGSGGMRRGSKRSTTKDTDGDRRGEGTVRLNKTIADAGIASRRTADTMIADGRVRINGEVVTELGVKVSSSDRVMVDGHLIADPARHIYILLNKPKDVITTTNDERGRRTVLDLVDVHDRIYPIGRLDRNTTGVLLLTNDGELAHRLMHPSYGTPRLYDITLDRPLDFRDAREITGGVQFENGEITAPCEISMDDSDRRRVHAMLFEGKNREVRRLFEHFGYDVDRLDRREYAGLTTRGLARGEWRRLDRRELSALRRAVGLQ